MRVSLVLLGSCLVGLAGAFSPTPSSLSCSNTVGSKNLKLIAPPRDSLALRFASLNNSDNDSDDVSPDIHNKFDLSSTFSKTASTTLISWLATTGMASADSPDWGLFEGRTGSILHPITMGGLFGLSLYTAYLGFQWRRQRTLGDDISSLKKQMPNLGSYKTIQEALDSGEMDSSEEAQLKAAIPVEKEMNDLTAERKELASQGNRDKHYLQGTIIAFLGTVFAIEVSLFDRMSWSLIVVCLLYLHDHHYYSFIIPTTGTTQYLCSCWKTLSRSTSICRCRTCGLLGRSRGVCSIHDQGQ